MSVIGDLWTKPLSAMNGYDLLNHYDLEESDWGPYIECDDGRGYHVIGYHESLHLAHGNGDIPKQYLLDPSTGELNQAGLDAIKATLVTWLGEKGPLSADLLADLWVENVDGAEDATLAVSFSMNSASPQTVQAACEGVWGPFWATMKNITDPGTFGSPYLWANL